jgi:hypothetical protein
MLYLFKPCHDQNLTTIPKQSKYDQQPSKIHQKE